MAERSFEMKRKEDEEYDNDQELSAAAAKEEETTHYQEETEDIDGDDYCDDDVDNDRDDGEGEEEEAECRRKKVMIRIYRGERREVPSVVSYNTLCCQVDGCGVDLTVAKRYHRRHRVCEQHAKVAVVLVSGIGQRFCQQCSRFHELSRFDGTKRSCRERLAGHSKRRRKSHPDLLADNGQNPSIYELNGSSLKTEGCPVVK